MLKAVTAWRDAVAGMIPEVPRGVDASKKITEQQVTRAQLLDAMKDIIVAKSAYVGRFRQ